MLEEKVEKIIGRELYRVNKENNELCDKPEREATYKMIENYKNFQNFIDKTKAEYPSVNVFDIKWKLMKMEDSELKEKYL